MAKPTRRPASDRWLGQGLDHQQIGEAFDQRHGGFAAEIDIGFVDHDDRFGVVFEQRFDLGERQQATRGRVRIREDDSAVRAAVIVDPDLEAFGQRNAGVFDAVKAAVDRIETVGDIGEQRGQAVLQQRLKCVGQHLVRSVADEDLFLLDAVKSADGLFQAIGLGIG